MADVVRCTDTRGREVTVDDTTWFGKITAVHGELDGRESAVEQALVDPDVRNQDKDHSDREVFYRGGLLPPPYHEDLLKVVVVFRRSEDGALRGRIVTAYAVDQVAHGEARLWIRRR